MNRLFMSNLLRTLLVFSMAALLSACAKSPILSDLPPQEQVSQRAEEYWNALRAGNREQAYAYLAPAYRKVVDTDTFWLSVKGHQNWTSVELVKTECEGEQPETCVSVTRVAYPKHLMKGLTVHTHVRENWVRVDEQWWLLPKR